MIDIASYKGLYIKTATECVSSIKNSLLALDKNISDKEALVVAHRNAHSLKSESMTMGYPKTSELAKAIEYIMQNIIDKKTTTSTVLFDDLKNAATKLTDSLAKIKNENKEEELIEITQVLKKYLE